MSKNIKTQIDSSMENEIDCGDELLEKEFPV